MANPWQKTLALVFMFKTVRTADSFYEHVFRNVMLKLLSTLLHLFLVLDDLFAVVKPLPMPEALKDWADKGSLWQDSKFSAVWPADNLL